MTDFWTGDNLRQVLGGNWINRPTAPLRVAGVTTDSRGESNGKAFIALKGETHDAHAFLHDAVKNESPLLIVERDLPLQGEWPANVAILRVQSTANALLKLANCYRRTLEATRVIAVGGSNGKTTTVRLIDQLLSASKRGSASAKSYNNAIGVPITILKAKSSDQYLICEAGTNSAGELAVLSEAIEPDIGVITSIGREHLEGFGDMTGVLNEEASLFKNLRQGGLAVLCADAPGLVEAVRNFAGATLGGIITFGFSPDSDLRIEEVTPTFEGVRFRLQDRSDWFVPLLGRHNASNATAAIAVARRMGLDNDTIRAALERVKGPEMRMERREIRGVRFVNDAYNANPESMLAAVDVLDSISRELKPTRRVVVLGDMLELGDATEDSHREVAEAFAKSAPDLAIVVGPRFSAHTNNFGIRTQVIHLPDLTQGRDGEAAGLLRTGDLVLLKGSRGIGLERVVKAFETVQG